MKAQRTCSSFFAQKSPGLPTGAFSFFSPLTASIAYGTADSLRAVLTEPDEVVSRSSRKAAMRRVAQTSPDDWAFELIAPGARHAGAPDATPAWRGTSADLQVPAGTIALHSARPGGFRADNQSEPLQLCSIRRYSRVRKESDLCANVSQCAYGGDCKDRIGN